MMTTCLPADVDRRDLEVALLHAVGAAAGTPSPGGRRRARGPARGRSRHCVAPDGDDDGVVAAAQVGAGDVGADVDAGAELDALGLHLRDAAVEVALLHLELGDAVAQQPADAVGALEHRDGVAGAGELLRGGEPGRARSR